MAEKEREVMKVETLVAGMRGLPPLQLAELYSEFQAIMQQAAKAQEDREKVVLQLTESYPRCICGQPAAFILTLTGEWRNMKPSIGTDEDSKKMYPRFLVDSDSWETDYDWADRALKATIGRNPTFATCGMQSCTGTGPGFTEIDPKRMLESTYGVQFRDDPKVELFDDITHLALGAKHLEST